MIGGSKTEPKYDYPRNSKFLVTSNFLFKCNVLKSKGVKSYFFRHCRQFCGKLQLKPEYSLLLKVYDKIKYGDRYYGHTTCNQ